MPDSTTGALRLPKQDLAEFAHFTPEPAAAAAWLDTLPVGNPMRAGNALRDVLSDLNRYGVAPDRRLALLDALRPTVRQTAERLTRAFVNDSRILSEHAEQQSQVAADLCELGAAGYALVAVHTIRDPDAITGANPARLACEALQRAIAFRCDELLQYHLLYKPVPLNHWAPLHHLYALAERQQLANLPVRDPVTDTEVTIAGEYLTGLLLACCRTNQLRQVDIASTYRLLQQWQGLARLEDPTLGSGLFVVDLAGDRPPAFSKLLAAPPGETQRYINTQPLVRRLSELRQREEGGSYALDRDTRLDSYLCDHLSRALGELAQRHFQRHAARHRLWIATGLTSAHYFVAGERTLAQVLHGDEYVPPPGEGIADNPFLKASRGGDRWQQANPEEDVDENAVAESTPDLDAFTLDPTSDANAPSRYTVYTADSANISPGGYCVEWTALPEGINVGDVVCLREQESGGDWSIAVIRWISQVKDAPTLLGLELLSPRGTAYAAQVRLSDGSYSRPIRVILLPEIPLVGQPNTLLAPRLVFRENQKIILARKGETFLVKLRRQVASTAAFGQFDFEYRRQLEEDLDSSHDALHARRFASIWSEI